MHELNIQLRLIRPNDTQFVWECLSTLRGTANYSAEQLQEFLDSYLGDFCTILLAEFNGEPVGMITCNRCVLPRYIGVGIEFEEVVIHPKHQGRGLGSRMVNACVSYFLADPMVRRITVHSDDQGAAKRIYERVFDPVGIQRYVVRGTLA